MTEALPDVEVIAAAGYMIEALQLAARGKATTHPNPRVGCVIVRDGEIVGRGFHQRAGEPHAEVLALRDAGERARGADVYLTLEPCSHQGRTGPCADALIAAGVRHVCAAMQDPNPRVAGNGFARLRAAGIGVQAGLLEAQAAALNRGFVSRMTRAKPWLTLKLGASLDGRTAAASGESKWITGAEARADVHRLRAEAGAVLTTSDTVLADNPQLNVRDYGGPLRQPDRIVLDRRSRVGRDAKVWSPDDGARRFRLVATTTSDAVEADPANDPTTRTASIATNAAAGIASDAMANSKVGDAGTAIGVQTLALPQSDDSASEIAAMLSLLAAQEINELLVECGPSFAGALLAAGAVDELVLYLAPSLLGDSARPLAHLPVLQRLEQRIDWDIQDLRMIGGDIRVVATPRTH